MSRFKWKIIFNAQTEANNHRKQISVLVSSTNAVISGMISLSVTGGTGAPSGKWGLSKEGKCDEGERVEEEEAEIGKPASRRVEMPIPTSSFKGLKLISEFFLVFNWNPALLTSAETGETESLPRTKKGSDERIWKEETKGEEGESKCDKTATEGHELLRPIASSAGLMIASDIFLYVTRNL